VKTAPVIHAASSDARKQTNAAISSGRPSRGIRCVATLQRSAASGSGAVSMNYRTIWVSTDAGQ
jgi:hypothetical protein